MSTTPPACTVRGCSAKTIHHHEKDGTYYACRAACGDSCWQVPGDGPQVGPWVSKSARIEALSAENEALIERGWADEKKIVDLAAEVARLSAQVESDALVIASLGQQIAATPEPEPVVVMVTPHSGVQDSVTVSIDGEFCTGMVFGHGYRPAGEQFHAVAGQSGVSTHHATEAEAVAAIVAAWKASR